MKLQAPAYWQRRGAIAVLLYPLSLVFRVLVWLRRQSFQHGLKKRTTASVPVIVVGNISVGGAGKTPLVIALAEQLADLGRAPGIVSRGYGGSETAATLVNVKAVPEVVGDEALMIARRTGMPVAVCAKRADAVQLLTDQCNCDVILSDDGLQHYALNRQLEICVIDARAGLGNGWCLPAGPLREPPVRLQDVDLVVYSGSEQEVASDSDVRRAVSGFLRRSTVSSTCIRAPGAAPGAAPGTAPGTTSETTGRVNTKPFEAAYTLQVEAAINLADSARQCSLAEFAGQQINAVAAIGRPQKFFDQLRRYGLSINEHAFSDHHVFRASDLAFNDGLPVLMTEKDSVKCDAFADDNLWYVRVVADLDNGIVDAVMDGISGRQ